jgi:phosphoribosyl-AMP cyclohydrolase / phosphoribosyl-ATP pyrophosphohydrolase
MKLDFNKYSDELIPAIIQDNETKQVLMLGFMNKVAIEKTIESKRVCFYSRTKKRLWTKGEESGNFLEVIEILPDCDADTLLIKVKPAGPTCHLGSDTCFNEQNKNVNFLHALEDIILSRKTELPENSYVASLFKKGVNKIAQKVGEEAVELVIESKDNDVDKFLNEAADLLFHYLILLREKNHELKDVIKILEERKI